MSTWGIITAGDVMAEQARTLTSAQQLDADIANCPSLDAGTLAAWKIFYAGITAWCKTPIINIWTPWAPPNSVVVTGDTGDTMLSWETQLTAWQQRVAKTCANVSPGLAPFNPSPAGEQATQWLRYGAIIAGFLATAYVVGKIATFIPKPAPRAPAPAPPKKPAPKQLPPPSSSEAAEGDEVDEESSAAAEYNPLPRRRAGRSGVRRGARIYR
jgi:hypothetical protein